MAPPSGVGAPPLRGEAGGGVGAVEAWPCRRRRGRASGRAPTLAVTPTARSGAAARRWAQDALHRTSRPIWAPDFARINAGATPQVLVQLRGPNFAAAPAASEQALLAPGERDREFPPAQAGTRRASHGGPGTDPSRAAERWGGDRRGGGGSLSPCLVSAPACSAEFPSSSALDAEGLRLLVCLQELLWGCPK